MGKAARPMQLEFDKCGLPKTEVIYYCHKDHIDILEEWLIDQHKGPDMLNTTYPEVVRTPEVAELVNNNHNLLELSTWEHLKIIDDFNKTHNKSDDIARRCLNLVQAYKQRGKYIDEDYNEIVNTAQKYFDESENYKELLKSSYHELHRLKSLSLWDRIFNYKVYV